MTARLGTTTIVLLLLTALAGCSSSESTSPDTPAGGASASSAPPPPAAPTVGECHALTLDEATDPVDSGHSVPCRSAHTSQTFKVGKISALADGHLLAVDSPTVRARIAKACPPALPDFVGGDQTSQRLSRLEAVWFGPSLEQADAGADSFRCDVVGLRKEGSLISLPRKVKGVLDAADALDRFGTCGTAAPDAKSFQRVVCSERHSWRAVDVVDLPASTRYLAKDAAATGDSACKDVAAERANGALKYTWSFEWPTRVLWKAGQRYGYCWVPETG
jgi:Septum formation